MTDSNESYRFLPRPEAHTMQLDDLMPPVRRAVFELLGRIADSADVRAKNQFGEVANCFMVYGLRGTGKTTVLLSAKDVVCREKQGTVFEETDNGKARRKLYKETVVKDVEVKELNAVKNKCVQSLKNIVWLDVLDLEPLPGEANFLTILLTLIRNALDTTGSRHKDVELRSSFEEDADSARQLFTRLINDAALMWESIRENDTRSRANRQIAAANIYAGFRERFRAAMDKLSKELADVHGRQSEQHYAIVLPIDNIDRSTDHLHSIFKLAQMVASPYLWLVMAGDRENVETFLERAFWKELIYSDVGISAAGKKGLGDEDEAFVMARHQAAAISHKLLPPSHRIQVDLVKPEDTLNFFLPDVNCTYQNETIYELLKKTIIPTTTELRHKPNINPLEEKDDSCKAIHLIDLFDMQDRVQQGESVRANRKPWCLTRAAQHGLSLPVRGVLDLWQIAYWVVKDKSFSSDNDFGAEKIARTMLRNAIAESKIPSSMSLHLQDDILCRVDKGGTLLYLQNVALKVAHASTPSFELTSVVINTRGTACKSKLTVDTIEDVILFLENQQRPEQNLQKLPHLAAAWLIVLYDILILAESDIKSGVVNPPTIYFPIVDSSHVAVSRLHRNYSKKTKNELSWAVPNWNTFLAHDVFLQRWKKFITSTKELSDQPAQEDCLPRLLAAGWIACVLETYAVLNPSGPRSVHSKPEAWGLIKRLCSWNEPRSVVDANDNDKLITEFEHAVMTAASVLYSEIKYWQSAFTREQSLVDLELGTAMKDWLEQQLPLLLSHLFVPLEENQEKKRLIAVKNCLKEKELMTFWINNREFILTDLDQQLIDLFPYNKPASQKQESEELPNDEAVAKQEYENYIKSIGRFGNLHLFLDA